MGGKIIDKCFRFAVGVLHIGEEGGVGIIVCHANADFASDTEWNIKTFSEPLYINKNKKALLGKAK